MASLFETVVL